MWLFTNLAAATDHNTLPKVQFSDALPTSGHLILGVYAEGQLGPLGRQIDQQTNGALQHALTATDFTGDKMQTQVITAPMASGLQQMLLIGLGSDAEPLSARDWQELAGQAAQTAVEAFKTLPPIAMDANQADGLSGANQALGALLGSYYFDRYQTDPEKQKSQDAINVVVANPTAAQTAFDAEQKPLAQAIWLARNLSNEPANVIYPESFVSQWRTHFKGMNDIKIKVYDEDDMRQQNMGALYGVGQGSQRPPRLLVVEYMGGTKDQAPVVLVGKGITFDTGGISLKNPPNMWNMKFDMSGAASVIGTIHALAGRGAQVNAVGIAALAENMPGPNAQRPGDVVTSMSGKTIAIRSTDAEGRLVLADAIHYGDVIYDPAVLIDLATLTGSVGRALGKDYAGLFTRHQELVEPFITAGLNTGEEVWQLPLNDNHFKAIEHEVADVMNSGPDAPGASAGAAFIGEFVRESTPWVHFDIAGVAWNDKATPTKSSPGSPGFGIRLLNEYIKTRFE
ncbi:leucyl aminopeptidase [Marinicella meishanensis]|uniref:leucyl aminopeptidase n=1 Tax=Marinicella meishanensis TaxID=2873263 RepID=UPI001CBF04E8|nr:leucyl aminopeptidase [Marinicella sp. NBU2979]